ncbi:Maf-like protein [Paenibacillus glycanilyticus]|uniref:dTTP/UTP pyrophosphatase n=1 Tax=Paenibacillus glycanilyticus TaxID=126569 RepID=A0ABQ6GJN1_9BACL|nr:Maf family protein [Paenibacillus glycanilyticus]GLX69536.1 Maf-like protein [Paenibacillus glycanilyticus]
MSKNVQDNPIRQLVLASSSPRRKELVASLGLSLPVSILSSDVGESVPSEWTPAHIVEQLALRKANATASILVERHEELLSLVVGADTIVVVDGQVLGKPKDHEDALLMLRSLQGREHEVYTGVACVIAQSGEATVAHRMTKVYMKPMSDEVLKRYIATGEPQDKAGAYGIQGLGSTMVEKIEGCYFNVVGLPVSLLSDMLAQYEIYVF